MDVELHINKGEEKTLKLAGVIVVEAVSHVQVRENSFKPGVHLVNFIAKLDPDNLEKLRLSDDSPVTVVLSMDSATYEKHHELIAANVKLTSQDATAKRVM